jgi:hypothetical protein
VRPIIGGFFATSRLTGLTPHDFFGIAFWMGFTLTYIFAELWIRHSRRVAATPAAINHQSVKACEADNGT